MAQIGCFVPCDYASIRLTDKILTRISIFGLMFGHDDARHTHISSFTNEMVEVGVILAEATDHSLVIIDELGRGTSYLTQEPRPAMV